jgi:ABC-type amino acid transport substrate-binding protein
LYLRKQRIGYTTYGNPRDAVMAVAAGDIDAVVYDAPILRYLVMSEAAGKVRVLAQTFERQDYGIGLPLESALRKPLNLALLRSINASEWQDILYQYLGGR